MQAGRVVALNVNGIWQLGSVAKVNTEPKGIDVVFVKDGTPTTVNKADTEVHKVRDVKLEEMVANYTGIMTPEQKKWAALKAAGSSDHFDDEEDE